MWTLSRGGVNNPKDPLIHHQSPLETINNQQRIMADAGAAAAAAATDADPEMRRNERLPVEIYPDARAASAAVAADIAALIRARAAEGRQAVLGLATGSSPLSLYAELVRLHREEGLSFANVVAFNLDE